MELRRLRYFITVAEELHFGRAAELLHISTPTLSQQISALERSVGVILLNRDRRRITLTDAGQLLLDEGRLLLAAADRVRDIVQQAGRTPSTIDVRVTNGIDHVLKERLEAVLRDPALPVNLAMTASPDTEVAVVQGRADAALIWGNHSGHRFLSARVLTSTEVGLAMSERHRLAQLPVVPVAELAHEPVALFPRHLSPVVWDMFADHLLPTGASTPDQLVCEATGMHAMDGMLRAAAEERAVAPFISEVLSRLSVPGLVLKPMDPPLTMPIQLVWRERGRSAVQCVIDELGDRLADPPDND